MQDLSKSRVLFFVPGSSVLNYGTFASQVLGMARALVRLGAQCAILHKQKDADKKKTELEPGISLLNITNEDPSLPVYRLPERYKIVVDRFRSEISEFAPTHVYTREYGCELGILTFCRDNGIKLVYSMRGPDAYERRLLGGLKNFIASLFMLRDVRKAVRSCDVFTTLSDNFVEWCAKEYGRVGLRLPCCVSDTFFQKISDDERAQIRSKLGFAANDRVVVWCGNVAYWQILDSVVAFINGMMTYDQSIKCLFIANNPEKMEAYCQSAKMDKEKYRIVSGAYSEIPKYLQSCDVGIDLLAVDDFKSSICCPIKVGEYLASGLPVIISRTMGDFPRIVSSTNTGVILGDIVDHRAMANSIANLTQHPRERQISAAKKYFGWNSYTKELIEIFSVK